MKFSVLENVLWLGGFLGHIALLSVLLLKKRVGGFPIFTAFAAYSITDTAALFLISKYASPHAYYLAYWGFALGDYLFQFGLIFEIARHVLRNTGTWIQDARAMSVEFKALGPCLMFS